MAYVLLVAAGLFAGYVNAIAGAGSLLTLPALIFSGLDPSAANATNRISVLSQSISSGVAYRQKGVHPPKGALWLCAVASSGAAIGTYVATLLDPSAIGIAIAVVMVVMLVVSFFRPRGDGPPAAADLHLTPGMLAFFFAIGIYGGFIQAGAGVIILLMLSAVFRVDLVAGNAVKVLVIAVLTVVAIAVFAVRGETIDLARGLTLAAATAVGGVVGARAAVKRGEGFVKVAVTVAVLASAAKLLWDTLT